MSTLTYALLAVFAVLWLFVLYRFFRAVDHFSTRQLRRIESIRANARAEAEAEAEAAAPATPSEGAEARPDQSA